MNNSGNEMSNRESSDIIHIFSFKRSQKYAKTRFGYRCAKKKSFTGDKDRKYTIGVFKCENVLNTIRCKTATAPTNPAAVKATVAIVCSTTGG